MRGPGARRSARVLLRATEHVRGRWSASRGGTGRMRSARGAMTSADDEQVGRRNFLASWG